MQGISISGQDAWSSIIVSFAIFIIIWGLIPGLTIKYVCKSQTLGIASFLSVLSMELKQVIFLFKYGLG